MTSLNEVGQVMKTDGRGRVLVPVERREALLDEFEKSGMSGAKFARLAGIKYATFANWVQGRRKRRDEGTAEGKSSIRLMEAVLEDGGAVGAGLLIELPGGGRVRVESPLQLRLAAELLSMMAQNGMPIPRCAVCSIFSFSAPTVLLPSGYKKRYRTGVRLSWRTAFWTRFSGYF
jgi:hypothetical protein